MSAAEGVPRLTFGNIDRERVMEIGRSSLSQMSSARNTPRGDAQAYSARGYSARSSPRPPSAMVSPRRAPAPNASSHQSSRPTSPTRQPTAQSATFSRTGSERGEVTTSCLDAAGAYDQASSRVMRELYAEREEKRRLLHLMRTSTRPPDPQGVEMWNRTEPGHGVLTARSGRGRALEEATSNGYRPRAVLSVDARARPEEVTNNGLRPRAVLSPDHAQARPATDRPQSRPSMAQTPEDTRSKGFGFMLPFDVALPSFSGVFPVRKEEDAAPESWLSASQPHLQPSSRRGLDFDSNAGATTTRPEAPLKETRQPSLPHIWPEPESRRQVKTNLKQNVYENNCWRLTRCSPALLCSPRYNGHF